MALRAYEKSGPGCSPASAIAQEAYQRFGPFIREWVNPGAEERDALGVECPPGVMRKAAEVGLFAHALPVELGGEGADLFEWGIVLEQIGYLSEDCSFPALLSNRVWLTDTLFATGREDIINLYSRPMAKADLFGSFAYSEDADPFAFSSTVRRNGHGLVIDGMKHIVTGATNAGVFLVFLNDQDSGDMAAVIVERSDPGVQVGCVEAMGMRGLGLGSLRMEHVRVPTERLVISSDAITSAQMMLNARRVLLAAGLTGAMRGLHEYCIEWLSRTQRHGVPLVEMQNVQAALGRQFIAVESSRAILHSALSLLAGYQEGFDSTFDSFISSAKHEITNRAVELGISALRLLGGRGYLRGRAERFLRDVCSLFAAAGAQDLLEINLGMRAAAEHSPIPVMESPIAFAPGR